MASKSLDIALHNNDILFEDGDIATGESDAQHVSDTIACFPSWYKQFPADGVGILSYVNSSGQEQTIEREVRIQLKSDGYKCSPIVVVDNNDLLTVTPNAIKE